MFIFKIKTLIFLLYPFHCDKNSILKISYGFYYDFNIVSPLICFYIQIRMVYLFFYTFNIVRNFFSLISVFDKLMYIYFEDISWKSITPGNISLSVLLKYSNNKININNSTTNILSRMRGVELWSIKNLFSNKISTCSRATLVYVESNFMNVYIRID